jgi:hypothetical protein
MMKPASANGELWGRLRLFAIMGGFLGLGLRLLLVDSVQ